MKILIIIISILSFNSFSLSSNWRDQNNSTDDDYTATKEFSLIAQRNRDRAKAVLVICYKRNSSVGEATVLPCDPFDNDTGVTLNTSFPTEGIVPGMTIYVTEELSISSSDAQIDFGKKYITISLNTPGGKNIIASINKRTGKRSFIYSDYRGKYGKIVSSAFDYNISDL